MVYKSNFDIRKKKKNYNRSRLTRFLTELPQKTFKTTIGEEVILPISKDNTYKHTSNSKTKKVCKTIFPFGG